MTLSLADLNQLGSADAARLLANCCGSSRWVEQMMARRPFASRDDLLFAAGEVWAGLHSADWLEAFSHHPRIGEGGGAGAGGSGQREAGANGALGLAQRWSSQEQEEAATGETEVKAQLVREQRDYEARFGHIFLICATGKSTDDILAEVRRRMHNDPQTEMSIAAEEQRKITRLRLERLSPAHAETAA